jgi:hypothetical protein
MLLLVLWFGPDSEHVTKLQQPMLVMPHVDMPHITIQSEPWHRLLPACICQQPLYIPVFIDAGCIPWHGSWMAFLVLQHQGGRPRQRPMLARGRQQEAWLRVCAHS